jgi:hypothetical protein
MRIRNNNPLDLEGDDQERITVTVQSTGTVHAVNFVLDGHGSALAQGQPLVFTLNKSQHDPSILTMLFTFSNPTGGAYAIDVAGSNGGQVSHFAVTQSFGIPGDSITYTIDVV